MDPFILHFIFEVIWLVILFKKTVYLFTLKIFHTNLLLKKILEVFSYNLQQKKKLKSTYLNGV